MRPLSSRAQDCYDAIGRRIPRRSNTPAPPMTIEASTVGLLGGAQEPSPVRPYTEIDFQRHLAGDGPCPFGCCP
jgi:hypothetical protein